MSSFAGVGCLPTFTTPIVETGIGVPLYDTTLVLGNIALQDTTFLRRGEGINLFLALEQRIPPTPLGDNLRLDSVRVTFASNINDQLELGSTLFNQVGSFSLNLQQIIGSAPPLFPFPIPAAVFTVRDVPIALPSSIQSARLQGGVFAIDLTNRFPFAITLDAPNHAANGQRVPGILITAPTQTAQGAADTVSFLPIEGSATIPAEQTRTVRFRIQPNTLIAQRNTPFASLRITLALALSGGALRSSDVGLRGVCKFESLQIQSADVDLPPQALTISQSPSFAGGAIITKASVKRFAGTAEISNPFPIAADNATLTIPDLKEDGKPYTQTFSVRALGITTIPIGAALPERANKRYELFGDGKEIRGLQTIITLRTNPIRGTLRNDSIRLTARIDPLLIESAEGTAIPRTLINLRRSVPFSAASQLGKVRFEGAGAGLAVDSVYFDITLRNQANVSGRVSGTADLLTSAGTSALTAPVQIPAQAINPVSIQNGTTVIRSSQRGSTIRSVPDSIGINALIETTNGIIPTFRARAMDTIDGVATIRIPLRARLTGLKWRDTTAFSLPQTVTDNRKNLAGGTLRIEAVSGIPLGADITLRFLDATGKTLIALPQATKPALTLNAAPISTNGLPTSTSFSALGIELSAQELQTLLNAQLLAIDVSGATPSAANHMPSGSQAAQFTTTQNIRLRAFVSVRVTNE